MVFCFKAISGIWYENFLFIFLSLFCMLVSCEEKIGYLFFFPFFVCWYLVRKNRVYSFSILTNLPTPRPPYQPCPDFDVHAGHNLFEIFETLWNVNMDWVYWILTIIVKLGVMIGLWRNIDVTCVLWQNRTKKEYSAHTIIQFNFPVFPFVEGIHFLISHGQISLRLVKQ